MSDDDIIRMLDWHPLATERDEDSLLVRIRRVVRESERREREACAALVERSADALNQDWIYFEEWISACENAARHIRARGDK